MPPLAAPGTLWVLSSDGKYLVRPQADETSHKKQTSCDRQEKGLPFFSRITKAFASAEATRGLSDRPLDPFGAHPCMRGRNLPQETAFLRQAGKGPTFLFRITKDFASAEATKGLSGRPLETFGPLLRMGDSTRNRFLVAGRKRAFLAFPVSQRVSPLRRRPGGLSVRSATSIGAAFRRLFRLRKACMLSCHWRLCLPFPLDPFGAHPQNLTQAAEPLPPGAFHRLFSFIPLWSVPIPPLPRDAS